MLNIVQYEMLNIKQNYRHNLEKMAKTPIFKTQFRAPEFSFIGFTSTSS